MKKTHSEWCALAILLILTLNAAAQDTIGWYVVKAGDTLEGITTRYLGSPEAWRENWKLNPGITNPNRLVPGQRIRIILARTLPARSALVQRVARHVEKKPEHSPWEPARAGDRVIRREGVHTFAASSAELEFDDTTLLTLTENSMVFLREAKSVTMKRDRSEIEVIDGQADLEKPARTARPHDIEVAIGTTTAQPGGAGARARFRNVTTAAQVMSYRGGTTVASAGASVNVREGMGVSVPPGAPPPAPEKLLGAPSLRAVDVAVPRPRLEWPAVAGAKTYAVEICRDRGCAELVARATGIRETSWAPREPLSAAAMFWRVTATSGSGLDGYPAAPQPLVVRLGISGSVRGFEGATVALYRDDARIATTKTNREGAFVFADVTAGNYTIAVDSRTPANGWPEQTEGPAGAVCAGKVLATAGPCPGGKSDASDDASTLATAEHIAKVTLSDAPIDALDFAFSFDAVTSTRDAGQGSLRQFLENANALAGANAMRFLPQQTPASWSTITLASPLPRITDAAAIDGRAPIDTNPGEIGSVTTVGVARAALRNPERPELRIDFGGAAIGFDATAPLTIRNVSIDHAQKLVHSPTVTIENAVLGSRLDALSSNDADAVAIDATDVTLRRVLIEEMARRGIDAERVNAEDLEVRRCGIGDAEGAGVVLRGSGSHVRRSLFLVNFARGVRLGSGNVIEQSTFRANETAVTLDGEANRVTMNRFEDNRHGIDVAATRGDVLANAFVPADRAGIDGGTLPPPNITKITRAANGITQIAGTAKGTEIDIFAGGDELTRVDTIRIENDAFTFALGWETFALIARDDRGNTSPMTQPVNRRLLPP